MLLAPLMALMPSSSMYSSSGGGVVEGISPMYRNRASGIKFFARSTNVKSTIYHLGFSLSVF